MPSSRDSAVMFVTASIRSTAASFNACGYTRSGPRRLPIRSPPRTVYKTDVSQFRGAVHRRLVQHSAAPFPPTPPPRYTLARVSDRTLTPARTEEDHAEASLRPQRLNEFVGQKT